MSQLLNIISETFELSLKEIKNIKKEISHLRESIQYTKNVIEEKVKNVESGKESME